MMTKMTPEEKGLYTRYFYNSVIEFIYFVILYLETNGSTSLSNINRYVKFFKPEVYHLIASFKGKVPVDKLSEMLKHVDCFIICEKEIKLNEKINWKDIIFEDFVLTKCVDLLLRSRSNIDELYKNLNLNILIKISRNSLLHVIDKYSYMSVHRDQTVTLHHFHGLIGFEDYIRKSVIDYFYNILFHSKVSSYEEVKSHSKSLSLCGLNNMIEALSILYCSHQFKCHDSCVVLNKRCKKYLKQKVIDIEKMETHLSSKSMHVGQVVYRVYGSSLKCWVGEICTIKENYGVIYCVVNYTNGFQEVFNVFFFKSALKIISEFNDLRKYFNLRDVVVFDAEYYDGKMLGRCWKATKVELHSNKFPYNEPLYEKLNSDTQIERNKCFNNKDCSKIYSKKIVFVADSDNVENKECVEEHLAKEKIKTYENEECIEQHLAKEKIKTSDYESWSSCDSNNGSDTEDNNMGNVSSTHISKGLSFNVSNEHDLDYLFMFGYVYMLMEDKGIAIAKYGKKCYNILFTKDSVFVKSRSEHFFSKGQKMLVLVPYFKNLEKLDSICVSTLVYGLNEKESNETEDFNISPKEFAAKTLFSSLNGLYNTTNNNYNSFDIVFQKFLAPDLRKLFDFIQMQNRLPFAKDKMLIFLHSMWKANLNSKNFDNEVMQHFVRLNKCLTKRLQREKVGWKYIREIKTVNDNVGKGRKKILQFTRQILEKRFCSESDIESSSSFTGAFIKKASSEHNMHDLYLRPESLNDSVSSTTSCCSFKTCSTDWSEVFYSCESDLDSPDKSSVSFFDNDVSDYPNKERSPPKVTIVPEIDVTSPLPTLINEKCKILSINSCKNRKEYKNISTLKSYKCLSLRSVPSLKCRFKFEKRIVLPQYLKTVKGNCVRRPLTLKARVSMISKTFVFFSVNIESHDVLLPFSKEIMPFNLLETVKLDSSCELTVIPSAILNLSRILTFNRFI